MGERIGVSDGEDDLQALGLALRAIVEGTSAVTGTGFFRSLVRHLASALQVRYAFVAETVGDNAERMKTCAFWTGEGFADDSEYALAGAPCENVMERAICYDSESVQQRYSGDNGLVAMGVQTYMGTPIFDSEGNLLGVLAVMHDTVWRTDLDLPGILSIFAARAGAELERLRGVTALQQREAMYRHAITTADGVVYQTIALESHYAFMDEGIERLIGYRAAEMSKDLWGEIITCYRPHGALEGLSKAEAVRRFRAGEIATWSVDYECRTKQGEIRWLADSSVPVYDSTGRVTGALGILQDITERKQAEEALRVREEAALGFSEQLKRLHELSIELSRTDSLDSLCRRAVERARSDLGFDRFAIWLYNNDRTRLIGTYGTDELGRTTDEHHLTWTVFDPWLLEFSDCGSPVNIFRDAPLRNIQEQQIGRGWNVTVALRDAESLIGVFSVDNLLQGRPLEESQVELLGLYGSIVGHLCVRKKTEEDLTAISADNVRLFQDLQRTHTELELSYDATIEGWSHALDLRDKETEGHSQRVSEMTLRLARALDIGDEELVHIRRGALLHDIGKMGIPDSILLKPGPLTSEEWVLMQQHVAHAFAMLSPVDFLRPALDIPYCHHERWDGTGYPRGLKGEAIPLAARIFAVVDAWDALLSDRPYRPAWPVERVLDHLRSSAGSQFDPNVVEVFLQLDPVSDWLSARSRSDRL